MSRSRPDRPRSDEPTPELDDLEELEELEEPEAATVEELEELEELPDPIESPVKAVRRADPGTSYDVVIDVTVPEMPKSEVIDALTPVLAQCIATHAGAIRWRSLLVEFQGEALIPSAAKEAVAKIVKAARPSLAAIQRGYADETVFECDPPNVSVTITEIDGDPARLRASIDSQDAEPNDLPDLLRTALAPLVSRAAGAAIDIESSVILPSPARAVLRELLAAADAARVNVARSDGTPRPLLDRDLEARVVVRGSQRDDTDVEIAIAPLESEDTTVLAIGLALTDSAATLRGRRVLFTFADRAARAAELTYLTGLITEFGLQALAVRRGTESPDLMWPTMLKIKHRDLACSVKVAAGGRDDTAIAKAFVREIADQGEAINGRDVSIDWPQGFAVDAGLERAVLREGLLLFHPRSVAYTFAGGEREPVFPPPVVINADQEGVATVELDTSAKPVELTRSIHRRLRAARPDLSARRVTLHVRGGGAVSRRMRAALVEEFEQAGARALRIEDQGAVEVALPRMLELTSEGNGVARLRISAGDRTMPQVASSAAAELDAFELAPETTVIVAGGTGDTAVIEALVARGQGRVELDSGNGPLQVHPALIAVSEHADGPILTADLAGSTGDEDRLRRRVERELPARLAAIGDVSGRTITLTWPGAAQPATGAAARAIELLIAAAPTAVLLDRGDGAPETVHSELEELDDLPETATDPAPDTPAVPTASEPTAPAVPRIVARNDLAIPPTALLTVPWAGDDATVTALEPDLAACARELAGRVVLVLFQHGAREVAVPDTHRIVQSVRRHLEAGSAAVLLARRTAVGIGFEVVASSHEALAVGTRFGDPRARRSGVPTSPAT